MVDLKMVAHKKFYFFLSSKDMWYTLYFSFPQVLLVIQQVIRLAALIDWLEPIEQKWVRSKCRQEQAVGPQLINMDSDSYSKWKKIDPASTNFPTTTDNVALPSACPPCVCLYGGPPTSGHAPNERALLDLIPYYGIGHLLDSLSGYLLWKSLHCQMRCLPGPSLHPCEAHHAGGGCPDWSFPHSISRLSHCRE